MPSKATKKKTIVVKCVDCNLVVGTEKGTRPELETQWSICGRCLAKRNGLFSAKNFGELGIY